MADNDYAQHWETLMDAWNTAYGNARDARAEVTRAFVDCANKMGVGPTAEQIKAAEAAEEFADKMRAEADNLVRKAFGGDPK